MHQPRMNTAPTVAKPVGVVALNMKSLFGVVLEHGYCIVLSVHEKVHSMGPQKRGVEAIEKYRPPASLCMPDLSGKDRFFGGSAPIPLEILIAEYLDQFQPQCIGGAAQRDVTCR